MSYLASMRRTYEGPVLEEDEMDPDPLTEFGKWMDEVVTLGHPEPNAMILATVGLDGDPNARIVLLKECDSHGFSFFTNRQSVKGRELSGGSAASLVFPWHAVNRQVRVRGQVADIPASVAAEYFATRPRESQLAAWASSQSAVLASREQLQKQYAGVAARYPDGEIPLPEDWGGYVVRPREVEFWSGRPARLHERVRYTREASDEWTLTRLSP